MFLTWHAYKNEPNPREFRVFLGLCKKVAVVTLLSYRRYPRVGFLLLLRRKRVTSTQYAQYKEWSMLGFGAYDGSYLLWSPDIERSHVFGVVFI